MEHAHFDTDENRWLSGEPRTPVTSDLGGSQGKDELVAIRKRVYGHDMLYVSQPDGSKIGRINLETGRITMDRAELRDIFDRFVAGWRATHMGQQPPSDDDRDEGTRPTGPHASHESNPTPHAGLPTPQTPDPPWQPPDPATRAPDPTWPAPEPLPQAAEPAPTHCTDLPQVEPIAPVAPVSADATDTAGASAQNEYHRRSERELATKHQKVADDAQWRQQIKAERPVMGRVATALTAKPRITQESQATAAWKVGAEGERRVGEVLQGVRGIEVLHDRLIPGSRANIDHLVVGPSGVFVIDAKKYTGKLEVRDKGGLFRHDPHLYVNGRDRTKTADGVLRQVKVVRTALGDDFADVQIRGVLCFIGAKWPLMKHPHRVNGVVVVWPKGLPKVVTASGALDDRVADVAEQLRSRLRSAGQ